jgi:hypothetical protein
MSAYVSIYHELVRGVLWIQAGVRAPVYHRQQNSQYITGLLRLYSGAIKALLRLPSTAEESAPTRERSQHMSAYVSICQHTSPVRTRDRGCMRERRSSTTASRDRARLSTCIRQHTSAYVSIRQRAKEVDHIIQRPSHVKY